MLWAFVMMFISIDSSGQSSIMSTLLNLSRYLFAFLFPNVTVKRALYNIKINKNFYCITSLNNILQGK
jgi:hypothetical protein